jgi:hypothetical protein
MTETLRGGVDDRTILGFTYMAYKLRLRTNRDMHFRFEIYKARTITYTYIYSIHREINYSVVERSFHMILVR